jgi:uncharacterized membrane protein YkvA (DUF1232 family)
MIIRFEEKDNKMDDKITLNEDEQFSGFYETLKKNINEYDGKYKDIVKYCPRFFNLLCCILNDRIVDWNTKLMIDAALAYFVLPDDIIPDHEEAGYVDDLFIVCHVLKEIKDNVSSDLIKENWDGDEEIIPLIDELYDKSSHVVASHTLDILRKVGLQKYQALDIAEYSGTYPHKIAKLANEKRELLGLLAFLVKQIYRVHTRGWRMQQIKEFLEEQGDYDEINRLIELSRMNHQYSTPTKIVKEKKDSHMGLQAELRAARMKALVKDDMEKAEDDLS